jgi:hypothetical protein
MLELASVAQSSTNALEHEPCRLLRDSQSPCEFVRTDSVLAVHDHPHGSHPLIESGRGVLEDAANLDSELTLTAFAEPNAPRLNERVISVAATWAIDRPVRPAEIDRIDPCPFGVREVNDCDERRIMSTQLLTVKMMRGERIANVGPRFA